MGLDAELEQSFTKCAHVHSSEIAYICISRHTYTTAYTYTRTETYTYTDPLPKAFTCTPIPNTIPTHRHVHMSTCIGIRKGIHTHVRKHVHICIHMYIYIYIYIYTYMYIYIYSLIYLFIHSLIHLYVQILIYMCMHMLYMHTHTWRNWK